MKNILLMLVLSILTSCISEPKKENSNEIESSYDEPYIYENKETVLPENTELETRIEQTDGEIKVELFQKLINLSISEFESWAVNENYKFDEIRNYEFFDVISYEKPENFISIAIKDGKAIGMLSYETSSKEEYLSIKEACETSNYKIISKKVGKDVGRAETISTEYENSNYKFSFMISSTNNSLGYVISLNKK